MAEIPAVLKQNEKPWWAPDAQGFVIGAVVIYVGIALFYRMTHPAEINDKLLDMMLTILYGTAFVAIVNYLVGSSRSSMTKDETQARIVEKLTSTQPPGPPGPVAPAPAPVVVVAWWSLLTEAEKTAIEAAAPNDPRVQAILTAFKSGNAEVPDLADLVTKGLLTQDRANTIKGV